MPVFIKKHFLGLHNGSVVVFAALPEILLPQHLKCWDYRYEPPHVGPQFVLFFLNAFLIGVDISANA